MVGSAIIVGVGPGLGASLARRFAEASYPVALVARRLEVLKPVQDSITAKNQKAECYAVDTTDEKQVKEAVAKIKGDLGVPEVLCYNVGPSIGKSFPPPMVEDMEVEAFRAGLETGVVGGFLWSKELIPDMKAAKKGTLLFTGATAGMRGGACFSVLSPGKFALRSLTQTLARELQPSGIHVAHVIVDGIIKSERTQGMMPDKADDEFLDPDSMAEEYWKIHAQSRSTWSQEIDLRPYSEKF